MLIGKPVQNKFKATFHVSFLLFFTEQFSLFASPDDEVLLYMTTEEMMQVKSKDSPEGAIRLPAKDLDTKRTKGKMRKMSPTQQTADTEEEKSHPESI